MLEEHNLRQLLESRGQVYIDNPIVKLIDILKTEYNFYFDIDKGPWIAGGAVRKLILNESLGKYSDIDLFFPNQSSFDDFMRLQNRLGKRRAASDFYKSKHAFTFNLPNVGLTQFIKREFFNSPEALLGDFDFSIIQLATDGNVLKCLPNAIEHNDQKVFDFIKARQQSDIIGRFYKYTARGYTPLPGSSSKLHEIVKHNVGAFTKKGYGT